MKKSELFIGIRKTNGQIGYISDGLNLPEFFELLRPVDNEIKVLGGCPRMQTFKN